ncbi:lipopolysaccharide biosynthesis protein [Sphingobacterium phlebotomi]|uniref:Lipopolysaccharide biosynthesis protein n=1 Tax=Sphingobacterium phlebotomi TaxID=2605433 RepID=A0A5D4HAJ5_9SPHI|nr:lipopolysaccharide biosynthesis protein [Sphingobacterium phlebotomi]TYR36839.1 lipopolysaccharide biosynthesis protein [Sphingobacterium phlebotomi]
MNNSENNKRIAKNSLLLYIRMVIIMAVSLYTSRIILNTLGVIDYGIYNVVGGIVMMATMFTASLGTASQRFLMFEIGKGDIYRVKKVFSTSIQIHIIIAVTVLIICETVGLWFLNNKLNIPSERLIAANFVYQFSISTFVVNIVNVPFNSLIISYERMSAFAYISILEAALKLIVAFLLSITSYDRLTSYGFLLLCVAIILQFCYSFYCRRNFEVGRSIKLNKFSKSTFTSMMEFASYNFIEVGANMLNKQGSSFLLNIFFGPALNTARGLSIQVNSIVDNFANNFTTAINPQITKSYANDNIGYMMELIKKGSKYSFYLFLAISAPILCFTHEILEVWLTIVPDYAVIFIRLIFIDSLIELLTRTFYIGISATGNIKTYQLTLGIFKLFNLPLCYILFKYFSVSPVYILIVSIFFTSIVMFLKLYLLNRVIDFSPVVYIKDVVLPCLIVGMVSILVPLSIVRNLVVSGFFPVLIGSFFIFLFGIGIIYFIGLSKAEKNFISNVIKDKLLKF